MRKSEFDSEPTQPGLPDFDEILGGFLVLLSEIETERKTKKVTDKAVQKKIAAFVDQNYAAATDQYRPVVKAVIAALASKIGGDVSFLTATGTSLFASVAGSSEQLAASKALAAAMAKRKRQALDAHIDAGFTREEAIRIIISDSTSFQKLAQNIKYQPPKKES